ncbi:MAG: HEAT repeat domain-containing protein [Bryobacterales bacterium]
MSRDTDPARIGVGLSELLKRGDVAALGQLPQYDVILRSGAGGLGPVVPEAIRSFFRNTDPDAIAALAEIAKDKALSDGLRHAAAHSLAWMHTRESVPHLAALLDDESPELKQSAVIGLSFFANGVGVQSEDGPSMRYLNEAKPSEFSSSETAKYLGFDEERSDEFVAFWRDWWNQHRLDFPTN